jgi:hypothetical protein
MTFIGSHGTLKWGGSGTLGATLAGFSVHDTLDLAALPFGTGGSATLSDFVLSVTVGGATDNIAFASATNFGGTAWKLTADAHSGTDVTLVVSSG